MGHLRRLPWGQWTQLYGLNTFVETGVDDGNAICTALGLGYQHCFGIELLPHQVVKASQNITRVHPNSGTRWTILLGDSAEQLPRLLREEPHFHRADTRVMWWLDAHFPERYNGKLADGTRLPLLDEVMALHDSGRDFTHDVIVIDDWRIYEECGNQSGPLPHFLRDESGTLPAPDDGSAIRYMLERTHNVRLNPADGGYLVALPR